MALGEGGGGGGEGVGQHLLFECSFALEKLECMASNVRI